LRPTRDIYHAPLLYLEAEFYPDGKGITTILFGTLATLRTNCVAVSSSQCGSILLIYGATASNSLHCLVTTLFSLLSFNFCYGVLLYFDQLSTQTLFFLMRHRAHIDKMKSELIPNQLLPRIERAGIISDTTTLFLMRPCLITAIFTRSTTGTRDNWHWNLRY
jgi:hypothetical protein